MKRLTLRFLVLLLPAPGAVGRKQTIATPSRNKTVGAKKRIDEWFRAAPHRVLGELGGVEEKEVEEENSCLEERRRLRT